MNLVSDISDSILKALSLKELKIMLQIMEINPLLKLSVKLAAKLIRENYLRKSN